MVAECGPRQKKMASNMTDNDITKLLDAWGQTFWFWRENVGIGDSFQMENERLQKNLAKLRGELIRDYSKTPRKMRSFVKAHGIWTDELEDIIDQFDTNNKDVTYGGPETLGYSEYLEY